MSIIIIIILALLVFAYIKGMAIMRIVLSHWHHRFEAQPFSPQEFYTKVEDALERKGINKVSISRISYSEGGLLSPNREYLRIKYKELIFDVCAAPFANEFFVSWWLGETGNPLRDLLSNIQVIGRLFSKHEKTFYELDTDIMFKESVSSCVKESIEQLTEGKGLRKLSLDEWKEYNQSYN